MINSIIDTAPREITAEIYVPRPDHPVPAGVIV